MTAQYPSALVTATQLPTRADATAAATNHINDHNLTRDELVAMEAELGTLPKGGYADVKTRLNALDSASGSVSPTINQALSRSNGTKSGTLLAQSMPWELCILSANAKATPAGTAPTAGRLTLMAIWLDAGAIVSTLRTYTPAAYTTIVNYQLSIWTYNGTTFTCIDVANAGAGSGWRGGALGTLGTYAVPTTGIYYLGHCFATGNTPGTGTALMYVDGGGIIVTAGDFTGNDLSAGYSSAAWPRVVIGATGKASTVLGDTVTNATVGYSTAVNNTPYVEALGTIL